MKLHELDCYKSGWHSLDVVSDGSVEISNWRLKKRWVIKVKNLGKPNEKVTSVKEYKME